MFFRMVYKSGQIFLPFCHNTRVWQTDRRTGRQTDRQTEFSSQYRVCITCSAVKSIDAGSQKNVVFSDISLMGDIGRGSPSVIALKW